MPPATMKLCMQDQSISDLRGFLQYSINRYQENECVVWETLIVSAAYSQKPGLAFKSQRRQIRAEVVQKGRAGMTNVNNG